MKSRCLIFLFVAAVLSGCGGKGYEPHPIVRLDRIVASWQHTPPAEQDSILSADNGDFAAMFAVLGRPYFGTSSDISEWSQSSAVEWFQPPVDSVFPDIRLQERQLGHILGSAAAAGVELPELSYATVVWGNPRPIVRVDTTVLIALNHYLGADFPGYSHWHDYVRAVKAPRQLPYDLAAALCATQYPFSVDGDATLLAWMLYEGALVEARMRMVPDALLNEALGYTPEQLAEVEAAESAIWEELATRRLVYSTDPSVIDQLIAPAPFSALQRSRVAGRAGRYIGYRIVAAYLKSHRDTSLVFLLSPQFYASSQSLIESGYR